jgi:hypothetical protein
MLATNNTFREMTVTLSGKIMSFLLERVSVKGVEEGAIRVG